MRSVALNRWDTGLCSTRYLRRVTLGTILQRVAVRVTRRSPVRERDHEHEHEHGTVAPIVFTAASSAFSTRRADRGS